jgi:cobalt/nickel transport system ATP-binding protein
MADDQADAVLEIDGLHYRYPTGREALDAISFRIVAGERVGIVGPSGAGKSTLLMHFNGLLPNPPANGTNDDSRAPVVVCGRPLIKRNLREVRRDMGFMFQDPDDQLFCPTVREDIAFGPLNLGLSRDEVLRRVTESLETVGLSGFEDRATMQLSVGERKRVCLAGVLACSPTMLALDEPSSNLDPRSRRTLISLLRDFSGAQIIATHDLELVVELCERVIVLDNGRIQADGTTQRILADERLMQNHGLEVPLSIRFGA